ncbi:MAG: hypothetical protein LBJ10_03960, partial [Clostridiales bacterium]|nr:hypothetical protein [Clostridiales bacterium]
RPRAGKIKSAAGQTHSAFAVCTHLLYRAARARVKPFWRKLRTFIYLSHIGAIFAAGFVRIMRRR